MTENVSPTERTAEEAEKEVEETLVVEKTKAAVGGAETKGKPSSPSVHAV